LYWEKAHGFKERKGTGRSWGRAGRSKREIWDCYEKRGLKGGLFSQGRASRGKKEYGKEKRGQGTPCGLRRGKRKGIVGKLVGSKGRVFRVWARRGCREGVMPPRKRVLFRLEATTPEAGPRARFKKGNGRCDMTR